MSVIQTDRLLKDIGQRIQEVVTDCAGGLMVCKVMTTHAGASELECCDCVDGDNDTFAVTVWDERQFPSAVPPLPIEPEPNSSAWVDVHEVHFTVATCWPGFDREIPLQNDPREATANTLAKVRDCLRDWLSSCAGNTASLTDDPNLKVWNRGSRAERAMHAESRLECRGWEFTLYVW